MDDNKCPICYSSSLNVFYEGPIRKGKFPSVEENQTIYKCENCTTRFQRFVMEYESDTYRELTNGSNKLEKLSFLSNELDNQLRFIDKENLEHKSIIDVGCATGFLLDYMKPLVAKTSAIEKNKQFLNFLSQSGHNTYNDFDTIDDEKFDLVFCFNVIEHVDDAVEFVSNLYKILKPGGELIIETPNARDYLIDLLGNDFNSFFYRVQHRYYFDEESLGEVLNRANIFDYDFLYSQKYGLNNLFYWVKNKAPGKDIKFSFSNSLQESFKRELEHNKASDHIIIKIRKNV